MTTKILKGSEFSKRSGALRSTADLLCRVADLVIHSEKGEHGSKLWLSSWCFYSWPFAKLVHGGHAQSIVSRTLKPLPLGGIEETNVTVGGFEEYVPS